MASFDGLERFHWSSSGAGCHRENASSLAGAEGQHESDPLAQPSLATGQGALQLLALRIVEDRCWSGSWTTLDLVLEWPQPPSEGKLFVRV